MTRANQPEVIERTILYDTPSESDAFSGGGHRRTARSLAKTIRKFNDRDRSIGLEGNWGSGKSTIVKLAEKELAADDTTRAYHIFTFDLWANQTVPFRRAFLEAFLSWGFNQFPKHKEFIDEQQNVIGDRRKKVRTDNYREVSAFGMFIIVFLFFLPIIYTWLSPFAIIDKNGEVRITVYTVISIVILTCVSLGTFARACRIYETMAYGKKSVLEACSRAVSVFSKEAESTEIIQNIRDEDPTKYEFTKTFRGIIGRFQSDDIRIVVVFDNIDRLPGGKVADIWSEVRAVFDECEFGESVNQVVTVIVPYDRATVLDAIDSHLSMAESSEIPIEVYQQEDIFRKTFDAIHYVAPPIISEAADFFAEQFEVALNGHFDLEVAQRVYKIFDRHIQRQRRPPTPRQLISFINSVTATWEQWQAAIPLETIAVYVVQRDKIETDPACLQNPESIPSRLADLANQPDLKRDLAALAYNVEPGFALQILLAVPVARALRADTVDDLQKLSESPGFEIILPEVIEENARNWADEAIDEFGNAARNLSQLDYAASALQDCGNLLLKARDQLNPVNIDAIEGHKNVFELVSICESGSVDAVVKDLVQWVTSSLPKVDIRTFEHGQLWIKLIGVLRDRVVGVHGQSVYDQTQKLIALPRGGQFSLGAAYGCRAANILLKNLRAPYLKSGLSAELKSCIADQPNVFWFVWSEVKHAVSGQVTFELMQTSTDDLISKRFSGEEGDLSIKLMNFVKLYVGIAASKQRSEILQNLVTNGALFAHAYDANNSGAEEALTIQGLIFSIVTDHFGNEDIPNTGFQNHSLGNINDAYNWFVGKTQEQSPDTAVVDAMARNVIELKKVSHFVQLAAVEPTDRGMFKSVARALFSQADLYLIPANNVLQRYTFLKDLLGDEIEKVFDLVGGWAGEDYWREVTFSNCPPDILVDAANREEVGWVAFYKQLDNWLRVQTREDWDDALRSNDNRAALLRCRASQTELNIPPAELREPLIEVIIDTLTGQVDLKNDLDSVVMSLPKQNRSKLPKVVFERLESKSVTSQGFARAIECFPNLMAKLPSTGDPAAYAKHVIIPLVESASLQSVDYAESRKFDMQQVVDSLNGQDREGIAEFLDGHANSEDDETRIRAAKLREFLSIPVVPGDKLDQE